MKKTTKILLMITFFLLLLAGCAEKINFEAQLAGKWYSEGSQEAAFILYDDGTCEIYGEYGTGTWSVVNDNQLKLTNFYGETETSTVVSIENNCLTLDDGGKLVLFWNSPQVTNSQVSVTVNEDENDSSIENVDDADIVEDSNLLSLYQLEKYSLGEFIDGVAYITYSKMNGEHRGALINGEGTIIKEWNADEFGFGKRDETTGAWYSEQYVVDVEGNVIFTAGDGQKIMSVGDNMILVYEEAVGFENAEARIGVVTFDGEWIYPMTSDNLMINDEKTKWRYFYCWRYAGEGCFMADNDQYSASGGMVMNYYETVIFDVYNKTSSIYDGKLVTGFENGVALVRNGYAFVDHLGNVVKEMDDGNDALGDGLYYCNNQRTLWNYTGEINKDYSQYKNVRITGFHKGYGYFEATGADEKRYFTIIDSNGDFLFDPIIKERTYSNKPNGFYGDFYNDEFVTDQRSFDISGNMIYDFEIGEGDITSCREGIVIIGERYMTTHGELIEPMVPEN